MTDLFGKFQQVIDAFNNRNVDYILIGGYAIILYGMSRLTQDLNFIVKMEPANIERLRLALDDVFNDSEINEITHNELKNYAVIRYSSPDGFNIDIMAEIGEVTNYDTIDFIDKEISGQIVKIATPKALYELKKNTVRPEDKRDAFFLKSLLEREQ